MQAEEIHNLPENCLRKGSKDSVVIKVNTSPVVYSKEPLTDETFQVSMHDKLASK